MKRTKVNYLTFTLLREMKQAGQPARCAVCGKPVGRELWHQCTVLHDNHGHKAIMERMTGHDKCLMKYRNDLQNIIQ